MDRLNTLSLGWLPLLILAGAVVGATISVLLEGVAVLTRRLHRGRRP